MARSGAHDVRRRRLAVAITPLAVLAVGAGVVHAYDADPPVRAAEAPAPSPAPAAPTTAPAVAAPDDGAAVASPTRGIRPSRSLARAASYDAIPDASLAAYQRAAAVIDQSAPACHLSWTLLGAIGRIESDHGRVSAGHGARIVGVVLDGSNGKRAVADTDGGELDGNVQWDRAVGPMQFLPSTWRAVGVDADGDGTRDPQDPDDAALAAAVYLCGSGQDLATPAGRHAALTPYNHSAPYARSVLRVAASYAAGEQVVVAQPVTYAATSTAVVPAPKHRAPKHRKPDFVPVPVSDVLLVPEPTPEPAVQVPVPDPVTVLTDVQ